MSIDSTSSSTINRKKTLKTTLSQSDRYPYSTTNRQSNVLVNSRTMSFAEDTSDDKIADLSSLPYMSAKAAHLSKRNRRFSELKPPIIQQNQPTNSDRRNSIPQINFGSLLPNAFRSNKHSIKTQNNKDELNSSFETSTNNNSYLLLNDSVMTKFEPPPASSSKILNGNINGSRSNLSTSSEVSSVMSHDESFSSSFILDVSQSEPRSTELYMLELNTPLSVAEIYRQHFHDYFHVNYCGEFQQEGHFILSIRYIYDKNNNNTCQARAIIRIPSRNYDVSIAIDRTNDEHILQLLCKKALLSSIQTCKTTSNPRANELIYSFDKLNDERQNCKVGFICQRSDQTDEVDIFNNDVISDDMTEFLRILADRVRLKGFEKYRGDLDVKNDLHGEYSYYTQYNNREIMFNIAPMIPSANTNGQCVKRKGLVGNSFVCIVFQESDTVFIPDFISGKVTQIYITVQPMTIKEKKYYKIDIWHRPDLTSIIDPPGGIYECDSSFRNYFLTLLLNAINVAIESPSLRFCIAEQRQRLKQEEIKKLSLNLCTGLLSIEHLPETNDETTVKTTTTNEAIVPNPGRVSPIATKKRTLSKILSVFSSRSNSISTPPNPESQTPPSDSITTATNRTISISGKEPVRRVPSIKHRPAPSPPVTSRAPVAYKYHTTPAHTSDFSSTVLHHSMVEPLKNEDAGRNRSNSSPDDHVNVISRPRPLSTASRDVSDSSSSFYASSDDIGSSPDDDDDDDDNSEFYAHRPTLTEIPLLPSKN